MVQLPVLAQENPRAKRCNKTLYLSCIQSESVSIHVCEEEEGLEKLKKCKFPPARTTDRIDKSN